MAGDALFFLLVAPWPATADFDVGALRERKMRTATLIAIILPVLFMATSATAAEDSFSAALAKAKENTTSEMGGPGNTRCTESQCCFSVITTSSAGPLNSLLN